MRWFYNFKIRTKILSIIGIAVIAVAILFFISYSSMNRLGQLQNSGNILSANAVTAKDAMSSLDRLNTIYADVVVNRNFAENQKAWDDAKQKELNSLQFVKNVADTEDEKNSINAAENAMNAYIAIFENQALPIIKATGDTTAITQLDTQMDSLRNQYQDQMTKVSDSITQESANGDNQFDALVAATLQIFIAISIVLLIVLIGSGIYIAQIVSQTIKKAEYMIKEMRKGHLSERLNIDTHDEIGEMAMAMDGLADDLQKVVIGTMNQISQGDVSANIKVRDDQDEITPALKKTIETIRALVADANMLSKAAVAGHLDKRGNIDAFNGGYKEIVQGVNDTLDAVVGPLHVAADYVEKIGQGKIPAKITETYYGDFDTLKNSINACIDGLGALTEGNRILGKMSLNDYSETIEATYSGIYGEIALAINAVHARLDRVVAISTHIADGDMTDLDALKQIGRRSDNDTLIPSLVRMIENIKSLVKETEVMANIAVEGDLSNRGDVSKFQGEFAKVIGGFNQTLDAVIQPLLEASDTLNELSTGNLSTAMVGNYQGDHAQIKNALNNTIAFLKHYVDEITNSLEQMGQGNFNQEITTDYLGDFQAIKNALNEITTSLSTTLSDINIAADQVKIGAQQISDGGQALSQGTTEQASAIEELTASIEEVASETNKNAANANQANELTNTVRSHAVEGNEQMSEMVTAMVEINDSSKSISKIIKVIDDIAFQTNILALNAAVEAARAGQHGKGFAVVAEEVRSLAARSAEAAKETTGLIEGSIDKVATGTKIADQTAESLRDILDQIEKVTTLVGNIAQASNDQASEIAQITQGIEQVSQVVQTNSATAEESAAASEELSGQAEMLKQMVDAFKIKDSKAKGSSKKEVVSKPPKPRTPSSSQPIINLDDDSDKY
ncbi:HAMP domain-containing protein [Acetobacterium paludosum]|uniref:HAMP domain-containing protein n=1 Tax=Acetobacterium paludosum TaxID=52693 RepID=A0A923KXP4_9FIRM|nr:methyl-accepting chemotaxis protein [Acetobacterium paludosum]MBC3888606.1 HAMP domain-containing protein [Acetobacterium paludosum]